MWRHFISTFAAPLVVAALFESSGRMAVFSKFLVRVAGALMGVLSLTRMQQQKVAPVAGS